MTMWNSHQLKKFLKIFTEIEIEKETVGDKSVLKKRTFIKEEELSRNSIMQLDRFFSVNMK